MFLLFFFSFIYEKILVFFPKISLALCMIFPSYAKYSSKLPVQQATSWIGAETGFMWIQRDWIRVLQLLQLGLKVGAQLGIRYTIALLAFRLYLTIIKIFGSIPYFALGAQIPPSLIFDFCLFLVFMLILG